MADKSVSRAPRAPREPRVAAPREPAAPAALAVSVSASVDSATAAAAAPVAFSAPHKGKSKAFAADHHHGDHGCSSSCAPYKGNGKGKALTKPECVHFNTPHGCRNGKDCKFAHIPHPKVNALASAVVSNSFPCLGLRGGKPCKHNVVCRNPKCSKPLCHHPSSDPVGNPNGTQSFVTCNGPAPLCARPGCGLTWQQHKAGNGGKGRWCQLIPHAIRVALLATARAEAQTASLDAGQARQDAVVLAEPQGSVTDVNGDVHDWVCGYSWADAPITSFSPKEYESA